MIDIAFVSLGLACLSLSVSAWLAFIQINEKREVRHEKIANHKLDYSQRYAQLINRIQAIEKLRAEVKKEIEKLPECEGKGEMLQYADDQVPAIGALTKSLKTTHKEMSELNTLKKNSTKQLLLLQAAGHEVSTIERQLEEVEAKLETTMKILESTFEIISKKNNLPLNPSE